MSTYNVVLETQEVTVKTKSSYDDILAIIKKTGKEASFFFLSGGGDINAHNIALGSIWDCCQLMELY